MSVAVVGSVALDTVETPSGVNKDGLGGAAMFFSLAASNFTRVHLIGVVGDDFPQEHIDLMASKNIDLDGLEQVEGKSFRWTGKYHDDINMRDTLDTQLGVFETFQPKLTDAAKNAKYLFLGNIHPSLQLDVLQQANADFVALDTMNLWINETREDLEKVLAKIDCLIINDEEVFDLTGERNLVRGVKKIQEMGPSIVAPKKGEHGCLLFVENKIFSAPAFPMAEVVDPTGAGDTFAGGFMGHIAQQNSIDYDTLKQAVIHGSVSASYTCEDFGPERLKTVTTEDITARYDAFVELSRF
ncbi:MAG: sugar kinase [Candidatus Hydrogenedentota bacterium]|nr:MAG: sugar kinase [Candidatus Hydrogenedentota bacterium]